MPTRRRYLYFLKQLGIILFQLMNFERVPLSFHQNFHCSFDTTVGHTLIYYIFYSTIFLNPATPVCLTFHNFFVWFSKMMVKQISTYHVESPDGMKKNCEISKRKCTTLQCISAI